MWIKSPRDTSGPCNGLSWRSVKESMHVLRRYENECCHYISQVSESGSRGERGYLFDYQLTINRVLIECQ